mmetsp:Transcript_24702/g.97997  ORF Transcript_24702/g.97997 Transcript_24702/m.97997 type:complete len:147 (-) Transcript_24702:1584-2024(-)
MVLRATNQQLIVAVSRLEFAASMDSKQFRNAVGFLRQHIDAPHKVSEQREHMNSASDLLRYHLSRTCCELNTIRTKFLYNIKVHLQSTAIILPTEHIPCSSDEQRMLCHLWSRVVSHILQRGPVDLGPRLYCACSTHAKQVLADRP